MIASVGNGWSVQRTDAPRLAPELLPRVDGSASDAARAGDQERRVRERDAGNERERDMGRDTERERQTDGTRQLGNELATQREQSRFSRAAAERAAAENAERAQADSTSLAVAAWNPAASASTAAVSGESDVADAPRSVDAVRTEGTPAAQRSGGVPVPVSARETEPADLNQDGAVGLQELTTYQARQTDVPQAALQQQRQAAERIAAQLARTYGRFDTEIANATLRVAPFYVTA